MVVAAAPWVRHVVEKFRARLWEEGGEAGERGRGSHGGAGLCGGEISDVDIQRIAKELGESFTYQDIQEMVQEADRNGDGL
ncbi:hypothetical protein GUJ93_ZPchr0005g15046 [Zizania palustris]|uniref:EF-hand domain-containing protein n=1 Tax=Zizania palustris TaxID=103762 RepID=A0A8J5VGB3_ZIZPA|nr:hypothetical protein GUJ93_ZPchr0005g15046 [Zizania palustris]